jgi:hypothetical protein
MASNDERRRHRRYPLQLPIRLFRGGEELAAEVINASVSGCMVLVHLPLQEGEVLEAGIPELELPRTRLHVVRCQKTAMGYAVATSFESEMLDEALLSRASDELLESTDGKSRLLH